MSTERAVATVDALVAATRDESVRRIVVSGNLADVPSISLLPRQSLQGRGDPSIVTSPRGSTDFGSLRTTRSHNIRLDASPDKRAIFNDTTVDSLGQIELRGVTTTGRVQILARDKVRGGHVDVNGLDIIAADARGESRAAARLRRPCAQRRVHALEHAAR